jgi:hypothetical protein
MEDGQWKSTSDDNKRLWINVGIQRGRRIGTRIGDEGQRSCGREIQKVMMDGQEDGVCYDDDGGRGRARV